MGNRVAEKIQRGHDLPSQLEAFEHIAQQVIPSLAGTT